MPEFKNYIFLTVFVIVIYQVILQNIFGIFLNEKFKTFINTVLLLLLYFNVLLYCF